MRESVFEQCQAALPGWRDLAIDDVEFDPPKGFSSFTMGVRAARDVDPPAVLYRRLAGKENAILDFEAERETFLLLGRARHRRPLPPLRRRLPDRGVLPRPDADRRRRVRPRHPARHRRQLYRFHQLRPERLPEATFFELLHERWGELARTVLVDRRGEFPPDEQALCDDLAAIYSDATSAKVLRCLPDRPPVFCHNDTYHGNVMLLDDGAVKLLDFEFSCLNHIAFDFANLFAETVMVHGLADPPHFDIAEPAFTDADLASLIGCYLDNAEFDDRRPGPRLDHWSPRPGGRSCCPTTCTRWPRCRWRSSRSRRSGSSRTPTAGSRSSSRAWDGEFGAAG